MTNPTIIAKEYMEFFLTIVLVRSIIAIVVLALLRLLFIKSARKYYAVYKFSKSTNQPFNSRIFKISKGESPLFRSLVCKGIKRNRKYEAEKDFIKDKQFAEEYFQNNPDVFKQLSDIEIGSWVTVVSNNYPVRGDRYCEYYTNFTGSGKIGKAYKVMGYSEYNRPDEVGRVDLFYTDSFNGPDVEYIRLRPATELEITTAREEFIAETDERIRSIRKNAEESIKEVMDEYRTTMDLLFRNK